LMASDDGNERRRARPLNDLIVARFFKQAYEPRKQLMTAFAWRIQPVAASQLRDVRGQIVESTGALRKDATRASHSPAMLDRKYWSDLERLGALDEGVAHFAALDAMPCPICVTPVELHVAHPILGSGRRAATGKQSRPSRRRSPDFVRACCIRSASSSGVLPTRRSRQI
jgi:hypothetical protein